MKLIFLISFFILVSFNYCIAQDGKYDNYYNERFGFSLEVPEFLENRQYSTNGDGCIFSSPFSDFTLTVYGTNIENVNDIKTEFEEEIERHDIVTYSILKENFFVISGYDGNIIFYIKTFYNSEAINSLIINYTEYPDEDYSTVVETISNSFSPGNEN